jgi:hypothetical protein
MKDSNISRGKNAARVERDRRLAEALRTNLKRRKTAVRTSASAKAAEGRDTAVEKMQDSNDDKG